jgi:hypothetical protein
MSDVRTTQPSSPTSSQPVSRPRQTLDQGTEETRRSLTTSEFYIWAAAVVALLVVGYLDDDGLGREQAWLYATYVSVAYIISRGLAKISSRGQHIDLR